MGRPARISRRILRVAVGSLRFYRPQLLHPPGRLRETCGLLTNTDLSAHIVANDALPQRHFLVIGKHEFKWCCQRCGRAFGQRALAYQLPDRHDDRRAPTALAAHGGRPIKYRLQDALLTVVSDRDVADMRQQLMERGEEHAR